MTLSKEQCQVFYMKRYKSRFCKVLIKAAGALATIAVSLIMAAATLVIDVPVYRWFLDTISTASLVIFLWFAYVFITLLIMLLLITFPARIGGNRLIGLLSALGFFAIRIAYCVQHDYASPSGWIIMVALFQALLVGLIVSSFRGDESSIPISAEKLESVECHMRQITDSADLATIALETRDVSIAFMVWERFCICVEERQQSEQKKAAEEALLRKLAKSPHKQRKKIRQSACGMLGHNWSGATCRRCEQLRDARYHWDGHRATACGDRHSWLSARSSSRNSQGISQKNWVCVICRAELIEETHEQAVYSPGYDCNWCSYNECETCSQSHVEYVNPSSTTYIVYPDGTKQVCERGILP